MADTLRGRLLAANLASEVFRASDGYLSVAMHTNEDAVDRALAVFATWLSDRAAEIAEPCGCTPTQECDRHFLDDDQRFARSQDAS